LTEHPIFCLDLSNNNIENVGIILELPISNLKNLNLSYNEIDEKSTEWIVQLMIAGIEELDLSFNPLKNGFMQKLEFCHNLDQSKI